ncbi:MAG: hypothetical protein WB789_08795 [Thermoplasmata archaeon]
MTAVALVLLVSVLGLVVGQSMLPTPFDPASSLSSAPSRAVTPLSGPFAASLNINPTQVQKGQSINIQTNVNGGTSPFTYSYSGLPAGCSGQNSGTFSCTPSSTGNFDVDVSVTDFHGNQTTSNTVAVDVTSSNNGNGNGNNGNGSNNSISSLLSGFGGFLSLVLIFGIVGFITWILLVVGIWIIAIVLFRRLPKRMAGDSRAATAKCVGCGALIPLGSKFCSECGRSTAPKT